MKHPDFILVGESRCGSTSFYETLIQHPQVILPTSVDTFRYKNGTVDLSQKELRFFDRYWTKGTDWYLDRFKNIPSTISGDASATYLYHPKALQRIKQIVPNTKIIILLRNPVDRFISHFFHLQRIKSKPKCEIFQFVKKCLCQTHHILERGIYHQTVKNCFDLFNRDQILIIKSEDFFTTPRIFNQVNDFLDLEPYQYITRHLRQSNAPSARLPDLEEFYSEHNQKLAELVGRDFNWT